MKTVTTEVGNLLSALSALGVEKPLMTLPGAHKAEVNYVAGSATVVYDETVTNIKTIKARVHECYHCAGERLPKHICVPEDPPAAAAAIAPAAPAGHVHAREHAGHAAGKAEGMAHEMGHGASMDARVLPQRKSVSCRSMRFHGCCPVTNP